MDGAALEVAAKKRIEMANFIFLLLFLLRSWDDWGCLQMAWGNVSYTHVCRHSVFPVLAPVFLRAPVQGSSRSYISSAPQSSIIGGINFRACCRHVFENISIYQHFRKSSMILLERKARSMEASLEI